MVSCRGSCGSDAEAVGFVERSVGESGQKVSSKGIRHVAGYQVVKQKNGLSGLGVEMRRSQNFWQALTGQIERPEGWKEKVSGRSH